MLTLEEYEKDGYYFVSTIIVILLILFIHNKASFDNTKLKNIDMEPFSEPVQEKIENGKTFTKEVSEGTVFITPLAKYKLYGRVYDHHYRPSKLYYASVYPYDVSVGFGDFQYKEVYDSIKVQMAATVAYSKWKSYRAYEKISGKYFKDKSEDHYFTNNHLCPANKNIKKGISRLRKKDVVYIEGYLMEFDLTKKNGVHEHSTSSTSRNDEERNWVGDNGNGTCEQIYVTRIVSRHGDFR